MSYKPKVLPLIDGGTNTSTMTTSGIVKYDGTSLVTSSTALIDSSNRYTNTTQTSFFVRMANTVSNVTGDATVYTVIFDTEVFDIGSNFNIATGIFTAPVTGKYLFTTNITFGNIAAADTLGYVFLVTSTASKTNHGIRGNFATMRDVNNVVSANGYYIINLTAADTIKVDVGVQTGTKTVSVIGGSGSDSFFSGCLLG